MSTDLSVDHGSSMVGKRKANAMPVPRSVYSYLMGALRTDFDHLKKHMVKDLAFVAAKTDPTDYTELLLEELFRYLYLLADNSSDGVTRSSPSYFVDQSFHCLMLDPVLYFRVCDEILIMQGKDASETKCRVLPHDALGGTEADTHPREVRYKETLVRYKETFHVDPPLTLWTDYSQAAEAVQADQEAQRAEDASSRSAHGPTTRAVPSAVAPVSPLPTQFSQAVDMDVQIPISLKVRDQSGEVMFFKVKRDTKFIKIMQAFAVRKGLSVEDYRFTQDGNKLFEYDTPRMLDLVDEDQIDVILMQRGC